MGWFRKEATPLFKLAMTCLTELADLLGDMPAKGPTSEYSDAELLAIELGMYRYAHGTAVLHILDMKRWVQECVAPNQEEYKKALLVLLESERVFWSGFVYNVAFSPEEKERYKRARDEMEIGLIYYQAIRRKVYSRTKETGPEKRLAAEIYALPHV